MRPRGHIHNIRVYIVQLKNTYIFYFLSLLLAQLETTNWK